MVNPLRLRFNQIPLFIHSKAKQIGEGIFHDGFDTMAICRQMTGMLIRFMRWCSLISLKENLHAKYVGFLSSTYT